MLFKFKNVAIAFCLICVSCSASRTLPAKALRPYGRAIIDSTNNLALISSAVHFGFNFEGKECQVFLSLPDSKEHNYLQYELDGVYQKNIKVEGSQSHPVVFNAPTNGRHTIWIYKATEAQTGPIFIEKIVARNVKVLKESNAPLIEFIGNSITCGAQADPSEVPCGTGVYHDQTNAYFSYGPRVARTLGTNFILSSVSGIGIYRNWNSDGPTMPQVYENTNFQPDNSQPWNFNLYTPKIVSIALGTNDFSNGDGIKKRLPFDSSAFVNNYIRFVQTVKSKYPGAQIALLSSPMIQGNARTALQNCLTAVKQKIDELYPSDNPVALYFFEPMHAHGCSGHPDIEDHGIMAKELTPFFKKLLK